MIFVGKVHVHGSQIYTQYKEMVIYKVFNLFSVWSYLYKIERTETHSTANQFSIKLRIM